MSGDGERVRVQTYVTASQRDRWLSEADDLDMSQAEYVRTMVQAGRRGFDLGSSDGSTSAKGSDNAEGHPPDANPRGKGLKDRIIEELREEGVADWDRLVAGVTDDIESRLEESLQELQSEDRVRHSGRDGGYTVVDDGR